MGRRKRLTYKDAGCDLVEYNKFIKWVKKIAKTTHKGHPVAKGLDFCGGYDISKYVRG